VTIPAFIPAPGFFLAASTHGTEISAGVGQALARLLCAISGIDGDQGSACPESRVEVPGIFFGHTHPDERAEQSSGGRSEASPGEG
jgi:hypothetical protein